MGSNRVAIISVVVPTYNRHADLQRLLENLAQQTRRPDEVIIVDSSFDDLTSEVVAQFKKHLPYPLIYIKSVKGLTVQRNLGIERATGNITCFLDDDVILEKKFLDAMTHVFSDDGSVGGVTGYIVNEYGRPTLKWKLRRLLVPGLRLVPGTYHAGITIPLTFLEPFEGVREVQFLHGGCTCYKTELLRKRPFSEFFAGYGQSEDAHYSLMLGKEHKLLICGSARLQHLHSLSGRSDPFKLGIMTVRNRYFILREYIGTPTAKTWLLFWWVQLLDHLLALGRIIYSGQPLEATKYLIGRLTGTLNLGFFGKIWSELPHGIELREQNLIDQKAMNGKKRPSIWQHEDLPQQAFRRD